MNWENTFKTATVVHIAPAQLTMIELEGGTRRLVSTLALEKGEAEMETYTSTGSPIGPKVKPSEVQRKIGPLRDPLAPRGARRL